MATKTPVTFRNRDGHILFGVVHEPHGDAKKETGILILAPGIKSRVAPHRLYVKMAKRFSEMGFVVLRFDYHGLGDSEGEAREKRVADYYGAIQTGRYTGDVSAAMDFMGSRYGIRRFVLSGLCGGAITGLLAASVDRRAISLLGLGIPVILDGAGVDHGRYMTSGQIESMRVTYYEKLFDLKSWMRLLTFQSDYRVIFKLLRTLFDGRIGKADKERSDPDRAGRSEECGDGNFNPLFLPAVRSMVSSSRKMLLIFSELDRLHWEFEEKFMGPYSKQIDNHGEYLEVHVMRNANHVFSLPETQEEMLGKACGWLEKNFP